MIAHGWATYTELTTVIGGDDAMILNDALDAWLEAQALANKPKE